MCRNNLTSRRTFVHFRVTIENEQNIKSYCSRMNIDESELINRMIMFFSKGYGDILHRNNHRSDTDET